MVGLSRADDGIGILADAYRISRSDAEYLVKNAPSWFTNRVDNLIDQPSRAAGRFGAGFNPGRPIGAGLKTAGLGVGVLGGAEAYGSYTERQTAAEENRIDELRAQQLAALLNDPNRSDEEKMALIESLRKAGFFHNTDIQPDSWLTKLGLTDGSLSPISWAGGGLTGLVVFLVVAWAVVRIYQSSVK